MKLVKPSSDRYHRERILERSSFIRHHGGPFNYHTDLPHYALSHLWGITKEPHMWDIGQYVDDEEGKPAAPISMRPEKRQTLLKLLEGHPDTYWWIDVLCARTDTPLDIMGDIYARCAECIAMVDCEPSTIPEIHSRMSQLQNIKETDDNGRSTFWQASDKLDTLAQCNWWKRVWTWQEMVLPEKVMLVSERAIELSDCNALNIDDLTAFTDIVEKYADRLGGMYT